MLEKSDYPVELMKKSRQVFAQPFEFVISAAALHQIPADDVPEIAFIGRSNVGKSSLINVVTHQKGLARTSNTPGRTQQINFFKRENIFRIADLPGYGYAKVSKSEKKSWDKLIENYLKGRPNLLRAFVLIDSRHGLKPNDLEMMAELDKIALSYQVILTKIDKIKSAEVEKVYTETKEKLKKHPASHPEVLVTSSEKRDGIDIVQAEILQLLQMSGISI